MIQIIHVKTVQMDVRYVMVLQQTVQLVSQIQVQWLNICNNILNVSPTAQTHILSTKTPVLCNAHLAM